MSKPNHTKSQLPMVRSLKAIARRKMNENIEPSQAQLEEINRNAKRYAELVSQGKSQYIRRMPVSWLRAILLKSAGAVPLNEEQRKSVSSYESDMIAITKRAAAQAGPISNWPWVQEERARRQKLFNELETIELNIISGETVDLAPYAKQLMPS
jgi:gentisate 1,2-dioxygenase